MSCILVGIAAGPVTCWWFSAICCGLVYVYTKKKKWKKEEGDGGRNEFQNLNAIKHLHEAGLQLGYIMKVNGETVPPHCSTSLETK